MSLRGLISYTAPVDTPAQPPLEGFEPLTYQAPLIDTVAAGDTVYLYLQGYKSLDDMTKDDVDYNRATSGVVEVLFRETYVRKRFTIEFIKNDRAAPVNDYDLYRALADAAVKGTMLTWYPDVNNYPTESFFCVVEKRPRETRVAEFLEYFGFTFELEILPDIQVPASPPGFV